MTTHIAAEASWLKHLLSFRAFPPLQAPETFNLEGVMKVVQGSGHSSE
jgi:arylsulfatase